MVCALNALFQGESTEAAGGTRPGRQLAAQVAEALASRGLSLGEVTAWRDAGWIIECEVNDWDIQVLILAVRFLYWNLKVAPCPPKGVFARHGGTSPVLGAHECYTVARVVSDCLVSSGRYRGFHWRWDLPPRDEDPDAPQPRWAEPG
jgi:hypothetical protein